MPANKTDAVWSIAIAIGRGLILGRAIFFSLCKEPNP
jgi:hypothetical protein